MDTSCAMRALRLIERLNTILNELEDLLADDLPSPGYRATAKINVLAERVRQARLAERFQGTLLDQEGSTAIFALGYLIDAANAGDESDHAVAERVRGVADALAEIRKAATAENGRDHE